MKKKILYVVCLMAMSQVGFAASPSDFGNDANSHIVSPVQGKTSNTDACHTVINTGLQKGLLARLKNILPQDKKDNVYEAVKQSGAEKMNRKKTINVNVNADVSIYSKAESFWQEIVNKVIEVASDAVDTMITTMYNNAVDKVMTAVNRSTTRMLGGLKEKLGPHAGPVIVSALEGVAPNVTLELGNCAKNFDPDCLHKVQSALDKSIDNGIENATYNAQNQVNGALDNARYKVYNMLDEKIDSIGNDAIRNSASRTLSNTSHDLYYATRDVTGSARQAIETLGKESVVRLYGKKGDK